jgi:hypothetical protein
LNGFAFTSLIEMSTFDYATSHVRQAAPVRRARALSALSAEFSSTLPVLASTSAGLRPASPRRQRYSRKMAVNHQWLLVKAHPYLRNGKPTCTCCPHAAHVPPASSDR